MQVFRRKCYRNIMKYYKIIGLFACALLVVSCFLPWTYYADLNKSFTGFYTEQNLYGKPGVVFVFVAVVSAIFILLDKIWAKRAILFFSALNIAYLIATYSRFTTCYPGNCPETQYGMYLLIASCVLLLIVCLFPAMKLPKIEEKNS